MKICLECDKPIDEDGENSYVVAVTKRKNKIAEFICFHSNCLQEHLNNRFLRKVKEKMNNRRCSGRKRKSFVGKIKKKRRIYG